MTKKKTFIAIAMAIIAALLILATVFMLRPKNKIEASADTGINYLYIYSTDDGEALGTAVNYITFTYSNPNGLTSTVKLTPNNSNSTDIVPPNGYDIGEHQNVSFAVYVNSGYYLIAAKAGRTEADAEEVNIVQPGNLIRFSIQNFQSNSIRLYLTFSTEEPEPPTPENYTFEIESQGAITLGQAATSFNLKYTNTSGQTTTSLFQPSGTNTKYMSRGDLAIDASEPVYITYNMKAGMSVAQMALNPTSIGTITGSETAWTITITNEPANKVLSVNVTFNGLAGGITAGSIQIASESINITDYVHGALLIYYNGQTLPQYKGFTTEGTNLTTDQTTIDTTQTVTISLTLYPGANISGLTYKIATSLDGDNEGGAIATINSHSGNNWYIKVSLNTSFPYLNNLYIIPTFTGIPDQNGSYDEGYSDGYDDGYDMGVIAGREEGYNQGYNEGYGNGLADADFGSQYDFLSLTTSVVDAPVKVITEMMDVEILGFNMKDVFIGLLSAAVIIWLIKIFAGG